MYVILFIIHKDKLINNFSDAYSYYMPIIIERKVTEIASNRTHTYIHFD